jgi:hypothetical protein
MPLERPVKPGNPRVACLAQNNLVDGLQERLELRNFAKRRPQLVEGWSEDSRVCRVHVEAL